MIVHIAWYSPVVSLVTSKTSAVNTRLLTCTNTNHLTILGIAHRVTLCILQCNGCNYQIPHSSLWQLNQQIKQWYRRKTIAMLTTPLPLFPSLPATETVSDHTVSLSSSHRLQTTVYQAFLPPDPQTFDKGLSEAVEVSRGQFKHTGKRKLT